MRKCFEEFRDGAGEQRVHLNRALLRDFFESARARLAAPRGRAFVTLKMRPPYSEWGAEERAAGLSSRN